MGSGKTTVGKKLANQLDFIFIDLDKYLERKYQSKITELFENKGEDTFRKLEQQCLAELSNLDNVVVSTGGGTPCFFDNMEKMNSNGLTIYLEATPSLLKDRLKNAKVERPLLKSATNDDELLSLIERKLSERAIQYKQAHFTINAANAQPDKIAKTIEELVYWR